MSLSKQFSDQAVVLKRINYGETDKILTIFTREHGKIAAIAKGVRRATSRKAPHIEPFTLSKIYLANSSHLPILTQAETINAFGKLKTNLQSTQDLFYLGEIIDQLLPEEEVNIDIFDQFIETLIQLEQGADGFNQIELICKFQIHLLQTLGFGLPDHTDQHSLNKFIEQLIDRKIKSNELH